MSIWTTAYLAYGFATKIHPNDADDLDGTLADYSPVGHLSAGGYDHDTVYLVAACITAELGEPGQADIPFAPETYAEWDEHLNAAAVAVGITEHEPPAWLLIADQS